MTVVTTTQVNAFLAETKYTVDDIDTEGDLVGTAQDFVFAKLANRYDTTEWLDQETTPSLVQRIVAMLVAAWFLDRQISDDSDGGESYALRLEARANMLIDGILAGTIDIGIPEEEGLDDEGPLFWPTDASTTLAETDPQNPNASPRYFSMGMQF